RYLKLSVIEMIEYPAKEDEKLEAHSMSAIEQLPHEIVWRILNHAPETALALRLTSRTLKSCSDEFAMLQSTIPFIDFIRIEKIKSEYLRLKPVISIRIMVLYKKSKSKLFKQRLIRENSLVSVSKGLIKSKKFRSKTQDFQWDLDCDNIYDDLLAHLGKCIGNRIKRASLYDFNDSGPRNVVSKVMGGKQFERISIRRVDKISTETGNLLKFLTTYGIDYLYLKTGEVENAMAILNHLSYFVRFIEMDQEPVDEIDMSSHYFLGVHNADWAPVFIDMFSNKLERLVIETRYCEYLSETDVAMLLQQLIAIPKKLYLYSNCSRNVNPVMHEDKNRLAHVYKGDSTMYLYFRQIY
ncbi:hypothetical protein PMAYCL1PPCAC_20034, partial [Pristionchus mayeri]